MAHRIAIYSGVVIEAEREHGRFNVYIDDGTDLFDLDFPRNISFQLPQPVDIIKGDRITFVIEVTRYGIWAGDQNAK